MLREIVKAILLSTIISKRKKHRKIIFYLKFKCDKNPKKCIIARFNKNTNRIHYIIIY